MMSDYFDESHGTGFGHCRLSWLPFLPYRYLAHDAGASSLPLVNQVAAVLLSPVAFLERLRPAGYELLCRASIKPRLRRAPNNFGFGSWPCAEHRLPMAAWSISVTSG